MISISLVDFLGIQVYVIVVRSHYNRDAWTAGSSGYKRLFADETDRDLSTTTEQKDLTADCYTIYELIGGLALHGPLSYSRLYQGIVSPGE